MPSPNTNVTPALIAAAIAMALVVYISNLLVQTPVTWLSATWFNYAQFTFPVAFLITDLMNRLFGPRQALYVIAVGFVVGGILSIVGGDVRIGVASMLAFAVGQLLDVAIFQRLRQSDWWRAPLISSILASLIDTAIFYSIAFAGQDWPWVQQGSVDFGVKVIVAIAALLPFRLLIARQLRARAAS